MVASPAGLTSLLYAWPILPGKEETWRRFIQHILEISQKEFEASRHRLGILKETYHLAKTHQTKSVILTITAEDPQGAIPGLAASDHPFDRWFRRKVLELHGIDLSEAERILSAQPVFLWQGTDDQRYG